MRSNPWSDSQPARPAAVDYPERNLSDLIDEDKRAFVRRKLIRTFTGGLRTVYDEINAKPIHWSLYLAQVFVYLQVPACVIAVNYLGQNQRWLPQILSACAIALVNWPMQIASYCVSKRDGTDSDDEISCSKSFQFFVHPRSNVLELLWVMILAPGVTFLACASISWQVIVVTFFSCYSLLGEPIPETTPYVPNGNFHILSDHYQRVYYIIIFQIPKFFLDKTYSVYFDWAQLAALVLQITTMIGNPFVFLLYLMEQAEIFVFGGSARASDLRILLYLGVDVGLWMACVYSNQNWLTPALGYFASNNFWFDLGTIKPFHIQNEQLLQSKALNDIVFADLKAPLGLPAYSRCYNAWLIIFKFFELGTVLGLTFIDLKLTYPTDVITGLWIASVSTQAFIYFLSSLQKRVIFRVFKCANVSSNALRHICTALSKLSTYAQILVLINYSNRKQIVIPNHQISITVELLLNRLLLFRSTNRAFTNCAASSIEIMISLLVSQHTNFLITSDKKLQFFVLLVFVQFCLSRLFVLINKTQYLLVSLIAAFKNKKQRIKHQAIVFAITACVFLPYWLLVLLYTTLLDIQTIPLLGFAFFIPGYPKPMRAWSSIAPVQPSPKDAVSDGHLYQNMLSQLQNQISKLIREDLNPCQWRVGNFYLLKNEKMIVLIQILERGNDYLLYTLKGAELQETTVCHAEENAAINEITESVFEQNKFEAHFAFTLSAVKQIQFSLYDDIKFSLTGTIDYPDIQPIVKKYFMRILAIKLSLIQNPVQILKMNNQEHMEASKYHDKQWLEFLKIKSNDASQETSQRQGNPWDEQSTAKKAVVNQAKNTLKKPQKPQLDEDDFIGEIENMLNENQDTKVPMQKPKKPIQAPVHDDLDDLENMLDNFGKSKPTKVLPPIRNRRQSDENIEQMWGAQKQQPTQQFQAQQPASDFDDLLYQSYTLLFRDKISGFPVVMQNIFNGKIQQNLDSADFLRSQDVKFIKQRYAILYSARLALHLAIDKFLMGEMDIPSHQELKELIESEDGQWFFGGEEFLWNSAIERCLPRLERMITKQGQHFMHKLQYGNNKESKFTVFELRREVARGTWGNLNMELLYYTNANDERFSIQAEKDMLRNLLVQFAEIPLGYPVFASGAKQLFY